MKAQSQARAGETTRPHLLPPALLSASPPGCSRGLVPTDLGNGAVIRARCVRGRKKFSTEGKHMCMYLLYPGPEKKAKGQEKGDKRDFN